MTIPFVPQRSNNRIQKNSLFFRRRSIERVLRKTAIREDYRGKGLDAVMGAKMIKSAHEGGLEYIDSHLEMENNVKVRAEMERMGGVVYKRYRIYQKPIRM